VLSLLALVAGFVFFPLLRKMLMPEVSVFGEVVVESICPTDYESSSSDDFVIDDAAIFPRGVPNFSPSIHAAKSSLLSLAFNPSFRSTVAVFPFSFASFEFLSSPLLSFLREKRKRDDEEGIGPAEDNRGVDVIDSRRNMENALAVYTSELI